MSISIDSMRWKLELAVMIIIGIVASCLQINFFSWEPIIKTISIIFTIISFAFLYMILLLIVDISILKEEIDDIKKSKGRK